VTENPQPRPDGTSSTPLTPDPPQPPGSDLEQVVDEMSDSAVEAAHEAEPPPEDDVVAPEGDAQHEPAD
jgi:hypothetical protein